jgi:hypothetical protein
MAPARSVLFLAFLFCISSMIQAETIYFAQVADGGGYVTAFTLCNPSTSDLSGTLKLYNADGSARVLKMGGVEASQFAVTLPARGSKRLVSAGTAAAVSNGWAAFETSGTVQGVATFEMRSGAELGTIAGVIGTVPVSRFAVPIDVTSVANTGFAVANASTTGVNLKFSLLDSDGKTVAQTTVPRMNPLDAKRQVADFVTSIFPSAAAGFSGTMVVEVTGGGGVVATGLTLKEGMLSAIPVFDAAGVPTAGCTYSFSPTNRVHSSGAETGTISITAGTNCSWTATSVYTPWMTITQGRTGSGNGTVSYSVDMNPNTYERSTQIALSGDSWSGTFTITQAGMGTGNTSMDYAQKLLGDWLFSYKVVTNTTSSYSFVALAQDILHPAQWYAVGVDEFGDEVLAGWFDDINLYVLVDDGALIDKYFWFGFEGTNFVAGCYYQADHGSSWLGECYTMTGIRAPSSAPSAPVGAESRLEQESRMRDEAHSLPGHPDRARISQYVEAMRRMIRK